MLSRSSDPHKQPLQIKENDKFYSRLLSKESSLANPSFRVYYGVASGAVPFGWESQPGTPKNSIPTTTLPPLTPPPSYFNSKDKNCTKKSPRSALIHAILPRLSLRKSTHPPPMLLLSSSSESSSSSSSSPMASPASHRRRISRLSSSSLGDDEESDGGSPTSTLCFRMRHRSAGRVQGCNSIVKSARLSIVAHGSGHGTTA